MNVRFCQTIYQQNTPFNNPNGEPVTEIKVTDPKHPLFKRSFSVLSISNLSFSQGHAYVTYREHISIRIPISATHLAGNSCSTVTKLTTASIEELVALTQECQICHVNPMKSG